jgi:hypothetical protein
MDNLSIEQGENSPKVILNANEGFIEFEGKSYPENTFEFYEPVVEWLNGYFDGNAQEKTTINFKLTYFNSATTQIFFDIFDVIQEGEYNELEINWFYDGSDESNLEDYEDYADEFPDLNIKAVEF